MVLCCRDWIFCIEDAEFVSKEIHKLNPKGENSMAKKSKKVTTKVQQAATKLLKLFGEDGKRWLNGLESDDEGNYCLIGGLEQLGYSPTLLDPVLPVLPVNESEFEEGHVDLDNFSDSVDFNDRDGWKPVRTFLKLLKKGINPSNIYIDEEGNAKVLSFAPVKV